MASVNIETFDELIEQLKAYGYSEESELISSLRQSMWTTSSEMIGELGFAILKIQSHSAATPDELSQNLVRCIKEVRKVWPDIKLPS